MIDLCQENKCNCKGLVHLLRGSRLSFIVIPVERIVFILTVNKQENKLAQRITSLNGKSLNHVFPDKHFVDRC